MEPIESLELARVVDVKVHANLVSGINQFQFVTSIKVRYGDGTEVRFSTEKGLYKRAAHRAGVKLLTKRAKAAARALEATVKQAGSDAVARADKPKLQAAAMKAADRRREQERVERRAAAVRQMREIIKALPDMELTELTEIWNLARVEEIHES